MAITIPFKGGTPAQRRPMQPPPKPQYALMAAATMQQEGKFDKADPAQSGSSAAFASTQASPSLA